MHIGQLLTLNFAELNMYKANAVTLRNAGLIVTLSGFGLMVVGLIADAIQDVDNYSYLPGVVELVGMYFNISWCPHMGTGGGKKANAELTLQKFNIQPENSMALGLGLTIRF